MLDRCRWEKEIGLKSDLNFSSEGTCLSPSSHDHANILFYSILFNLQFEMDMGREKVYRDSGNFWASSFNCIITIHEYYNEPFLKASFTSLWLKSPSIAPPLPRRFYAFLAWSRAFSWSPQAIRMFTASTYMRHQSLQYPYLLQQPTYYPHHRLIPPITPSTTPTHSSLTFSISSLSLLASLNSPSNSLILCS